MHMTGDSLRAASSAALLEAATDWLFRLQAEPADAALRQAHRDWLAADAAHLQAWLAVQHTWSVTGRMKIDVVDTAEMALFMPVRHTARRQTRILAAVTALAACAALALLGPRILLHFDSDAVTATAENTIMQLADGSTITLGGASAFRADVGGSSGRRATLLRGEAHFQIAPDRQRPFVIDAGPVQVTVVGTAFDVTLDAQSVSVAVASGVVDVRSGEMATARLTAGERVAIAHGTGQATLARIAPEDVGAWRLQRLVLHDLPLPEAIARLSRYYRGEIVVLADGLQRQRISGVFDLDDPARALRGMLAAGGPAMRDVQIRQYTPYLIVLNK
jgi:transmembrane sensor